MRLSFVACLVLPLSLLACSGGDKDDASDSGAAADDGTGGTGDGADGGDGTGDGSSDCPDAVPEQYRNIWDCSTEACGAPVLYRYGIGSSSADGSISMEETIFFFEAPTDSRTVSNASVNFRRRPLHCSTRAMNASSVFFSVSGDTSSPLLARNGASRASSAAFCFASASVLSRI